MNSYLLNVKKLKDGETINLNGKAGMLNIRQLKDTDEVVLYVDDTFGTVGNNHCGPLALLSYYLSYGIRAEKMLTYGDGYFPTKLYPEKTSLKNTNFDLEKLEYSFKKINKL